MSKTKSVGRADELEALSQGWSRTPIDAESWVNSEASRIGVDAEAVRAAFAGELTEPHPLSDVLEIPDTMRVTHKFSYGGISPFFRAMRDHGRLLGARCEACDFTYCPPRRHCAHCHGETAWIELPGTGAVVTFTTVQVGTSARSDRKPFICAYVRLDGTDTVIMTNIAMDPIKAHPGLRVRIALRPERTGRVTDFYFVPDEG